MILDENKTRVNISIDPNILKMFKLMYPIHEQTLSGFVEDKILEYAREHSPDLIMEREIAQLEQLKANYPDIHRIYNQIREHKENNGTDAEQDRISEIKKKIEDMILSKGVETFEKELIRKNVNYNLIKIKTKCKTEKEAEELVISEFYRLQGLEQNEPVVETPKNVIKEEIKSTKTKEDLISSIKASPDLDKSYLSNPNTKWSFFKNEFNLSSDGEAITVFKNVLEGSK